MLSDVAITLFPFSYATFLTQSLLAVNVIYIVPALRVLNLLEEVRWAQVNLLPKRPSYFQRFKAFQINQGFQEN